jgi:hypothetical protein
MPRGRPLKDPAGSFVKALTALVEFWGSGAGDLEELRKQLHSGVDSAIEDMQYAIKRNAETTSGQGQGANQPATSGTPEPQ